MRLALVTLLVLTLGACGSEARVIPPSPSPHFVLAAQPHQYVDVKSTGKKAK